MEEGIRKNKTKRVKYEKNPFTIEFQTEAARNAQKEMEAIQAKRREAVQEKMNKAASQFANLSINVGESETEIVTVEDALAFIERINFKERLERINEWRDQLEYWEAQLDAFNKEEFNTVFAYPIGWDNTQPIGVRGIGKSKTLKEYIEHPFLYLRKRIQEEAIDDLYEYLNKLNTKLEHLKYDLQEQGKFIKIRLRDHPEWKNENEEDYQAHVDQWQWTADKLHHKQKLYWELEKEIDKRKKDPYHRYKRFLQNTIDNIRSSKHQHFEPLEHAYMQLDKTLPPEYTFQLGFKPK